MKKNKITKIIIVTIMMIMALGCSICYAEGSNNVENSNNVGNVINATGTNKTIGGGFNYADYDPYNAVGDVPGIFSGLLNVLTIVGVLGVVIGIALIGFNSILGSASEKADMQQKLVGVVIAAGMIAGGSIIANWIIAFAKSI